MEDKRSSAWGRYLRCLCLLRRHRGRLWRFQCGVKILWFGCRRRGAGLRRRLLCIVLNRKNRREVCATGGDFSVASDEPPPTFEVEDSEFLCLRRLGWWRCCFCPSVTSPLAWGGWEITAGFTSPCSELSPEAGF